MPSTCNTRVTPVQSLQEYFRESVTTAMTRQGVDANDHTAYYIVNLLTLFARSEALYEETNDGTALRPLAAMLADAIDSPSAEEKNFVLQRVGDISLFVAGFFAESLSRTLVDVDYYVRIGGSAYGSLSERVRGSARGRAFTPVFAELARNFQAFVDVLGEVRDEARGSDDADVLRLYEIWIKTRSHRAARLLRRLGIEPNQGLDANKRH